MAISSSPNSPDLGNYVQPDYLESPTTADTEPGKQQCIHNTTPVHQILFSQAQGPRTSICLGAVLIAQV